MGPFRGRSSCIAIFLALGVIVLRGQSFVASRIEILGNVGLPAVDEGVILDETHAPNTPAARRKAALHAAFDAGSDVRQPSRYAPGRVIVKFREAASASERMAAVADVVPGATIAARPSYANFDIVRMDPTADAEAIAAALSEQPAVEYAQAAYRIRPMFVPNDPLYQPNPLTNWPGQWNLKMVDLERAWDIQPQAGSSITVAVLDTGVAFQNATITATIPGFFDQDTRQVYPPLGRVTIPYSAASQLASPGRFVAPHDFIWDNDLPLDFDGHGTHVSGTIGQLTNDNLFTAGVAFNVKLMPVKVIDSFWDDLFGAPNTATDEVVARGIRYAADNGAKIINMSIGRTGPPDTAPAIEDAIRYAVGKGVFLAIAAGNDFEDGNPTEIIAQIASRVPGAVSVAAVDPNKARAFYSSTGTWVELAAPGGSNRGFERNGFVFQQTFDFNFVETYLLPPSQYHAPRFDVHSIIGYIGTSMATPHVTGIAAMLMQQGVTSPAAIESALEKFAVDLGEPGKDNSFGFGLVDARNALRGLGVAK